MGLLFGMVLTLAFSLVSIPANAVSAYDNTVSLWTDDSVYLTSNSGAYELEIPLTNVLEPFEDYCLPVEYSEIIGVIQSYPSKRWTVLQTTLLGDSQRQVQITWGDTSPAEFYSTPYNTGLATTGTNGGNATLNMDNNGGVQCIFSSGGSGYLLAQHDTVNNFHPIRPVFWNGNVDYPSGYEGELIPEDWQPPVDTSTQGLGYTPSFEYTVTDDAIELIDVTNPQNITDYQIDLCLFQLPNNKYGDNFTEYIYDCDNPVDVVHEFGDGYADYNVIIRHYSSTTDKWFENSRVLHVDGTTFSGGVGSDASDDAIKKSLFDFDFPIYGLQEIFLAPINFIATLPDKVNNCSPWTLPLLGTSVTMNCLLPYYQQQMGGVLTIYQTIFTGLTVYFVGQKIMSRIKSTTNPKDDSIEVVHL